MAEITLNAQLGRKPGSRESRRIRREGRVPAIVYGQDVSGMLVTVDHHDLVSALRTEAGLNVLIRLEVDGGESVLTLPREIDRHPFKPLIRHVDFMKVSLTEKVSAEVGIHLEGEPEGVRLQGGILSHLLNTVEIEALPTDIPSHVSIDVSALEVGDHIRVADLPAIEGVEYITDPDTLIATVVAPSLAEEVEEEAEAEEGEEVAGEGEEAGEGADEEGSGGE